MKSKTFTDEQVYALSGHKKKDEKAAAEVIDMDELYVGAVDTLAKIVAIRILADEDNDEIEYDPETAGYEDAGEMLHYAIERELAKLRG
jgi:hypothetical protein